MFNRRQFLVFSGLTLPALATQEIYLAESSSLAPLGVAGGTEIFREDFKADSVSKKPSYTVVFEQERSTRTNENPAIIEGKDGVLITAWADKGVGRDNDPSNRIMVNASSDGGKTWGDPVEACPPSINVKRAAWEESSSANKITGTGA